MESARLSRPRYCRKGAQPMPKAVHCSGCRDKHNWLRPLTLQSVMPSLKHCDLLRQVGVNNLPKVVTQQRRGREVNLQPASCKSNALATRLPRGNIASDEENYHQVVICSRSHCAASLYNMPTSNEDHAAARHLTT